MYWETQLKARMERVPGVSDTHGVFLFCAARPDPGTPLERCDYDTWGPVGPMREGDPRYNTLFGSSVIHVTNQLLIYEVLFSLAPEGFLIYIEVAKDDADRYPDPDTEDYLINREDPPCCTRTFPEMLRLLWEWEQATLPPFNNTEVAAVTAAGILERLRTDYGLTEEVLAEVVSAVPPMQVSRFLMGEQNARERPPVETIPQAPEPVLEWVQSTAEPLP